MILNLLFDLCRWQVEDGGRRCRPWGDGRSPPVFVQQAFVEAMGAAIATTTQANAARGQGGASNL